LVDFALFLFVLLALRQQSGVLGAKKSQNPLQNPQNRSRVDSLQDMLENCKKKHSVFVIPPMSKHVFGVLPTDRRKTTGHRIY
jgi:hypothetical protein